MRLFGFILLIASLTLLAEHLIRYELKKKELNDSRGVQIVRSAASIVGEEMVVTPTVEMGYYSFQPPSTPFEWGICGGGVLGIALILSSGGKKN